jgi:endonuclease YncB( thermonuclease family)
LQPRAKPSPEGKPRDRAQTIRARVTEVVDGDTIRVRPLEETRRPRYTVRLIGIDTPEVYGGVECGGRRASARMKRLAEGWRVLLRTDPTQATFDRYDRLLAYAKLRGGPDAAVAQPRAGWAKVYVYGGKPFQRVRPFRRAQRSARRAGRGVWSRCDGDFHSPAQASATQNRLVIRTDPGGVQSLGQWRVRRDPTLGAASDRFGAPSSKRRRHDVTCRVAWRRIGLVDLPRSEFHEAALHRRAGTRQVETVGSLVCNPAGRRPAVEPAKLVAHGAQLVEPPVDVTPDVG